MENINKSKAIQPSLFVALLPFIFLIIFMLIGVVILEVEAHIPLIASCIITAIIGHFLGYSWDDMEKSMIEANKMTMQAVFIVLIVGCLIGVWISGGIVPGLIYYGLDLFSPNMFLLLLPPICAIIAVSTGSAWTTAGTLGVAAMGIGQGLGIPKPIIAGAVITGASFGDKMSPLSDSTNLAAAVAKVNVFDHVKHMLYTTVPSFIISTIIFGVIGKKYGSGNTNMTELSEVLNILETTFKISPLIFIAPMLVVSMVIFKIPAVPGMMAGTFIGTIFSFYQGYSLKEILDYLYYGFNLNTGNVMVDQLLNRGGFISMLEIVGLVIVALCFGGLVKEIGCIDKILSSILKKFHSRGSIITTNIISSIALNFMAADQYMAIVIPGQMYSKVYEDLNLHPKNLSRVLEDSGTLTSGLVPWSTCGALYRATLGVSAWQYAPFHFMAFINPIISILYAYTGFSMEALDKSKPIKDNILES